MFAAPFSLFSLEQLYHLCNCPVFPDQLWGLRRISYAVNAEGRLDPEYAEVYGVPFSFIPCSGSTGEIKPGPVPTRVRALEERIACEITFPRILGYRYDFPAERLTAEFTEDSRMALSTADIPTRTENAPIVGLSSIHTLDDLKGRRLNEVAFLLARETLEKYFRDDDKNPKAWLFPEILSVTKKWLSECVILKDNTFPQLLLLVELARDAADHIYRAIVRASDKKAVIKPILRPYDTEGRTRFVDFDTTRPVYPTDSRFCHVSHVVCDTESWEQKAAQAIEELGEEGLVRSYVKNQNLGFAIPYTLSGQEKNYIPDYLIRVNDGGKEPLNLILEVTGEKRKDKAAKTAAAREFFIPAVNNHGGYGRWAFLEIADPWDLKNTLRAFLKKGTTSKEDN